ncbi:MAG: diguanylate cyclase [Chloroflexota bacterium]|nr:MAG: diguanylate cyclase [Chloroflexota bacterium]
MESTSYLKAIRRNWWLVLLTALVALGLALAVSVISQPRYRATARFIVSPNGALLSEPNSLLNSLNTLDRRSLIATFGEVLTSERIRMQSAEALGVSPATLQKYRFTTAVVPEANVLEFSVEGPNRRDVMVVAQTMGTEAIDYVGNIYTLYTVDFLDTPFAPERPVSPNALRDGLVALTLGGALGSVLALARERRRTPPGAGGMAAGYADGRERLPAIPWNQFESQLDRAISTKGRSVLSVALLRLDGLEDYVDTLPPQTVQKIQNLAAQMLRRELLEKDVIGQFDRTGLSVILNGMSGPAAAEIFKRVMQNLTRPVRYDGGGQTMQLYPRFGIAEHRDHASGPEIIRQARQALDLASRDERRIVVYESLPKPVSLDPNRQI